MTPHPASPEALKADESRHGHDLEKRTSRRAGGAMLLLITIYALVLLAASVLSGCTQRPRKVTKPDGTVIVDMGRSLMKKSKTDTATWTNGVESMTYTSSGDDETTVPKAGITGYTLLGAGDQWLSSTRAKESTTRILAKEKTSQQATQSAADVESLRILNPVEEPAAAAAVVVPAN